MKKDKGKKKVDDEGNEDLVIVVLSVNIQCCDGCEKKVVTAARNVRGVVDVEADRERNELRVRVLGNVDPETLRRAVKQEMKKLEKRYVEVKSVLPEKEANKKLKMKMKVDSENEEPTTKKVGLKIGSYCKGCVTDVSGQIKNFPGVDNVHMNPSEDKLMVTGKMDAEDLRNHLKEKLKINVEILSENGGKSDETVDGKNLLIASLLILICILLHKLFFSA